MSNLTQDLLHELFEYKDGVLYRRVASSNKVKIGDPVGTLNNRGYVQTTINYRPYRIHRLIFLMHHGYLPKIVDHIDGDTLNNCIKNLREATLAQNSMNCKVYNTNSSGYPNVFYVAKGEKWRARVSLDGMRYSLGTYPTAERADAAIRSFKLHNFHAFLRR